MIQIQRREQFNAAAQRLSQEQMSLRQHEPRLREVLNRKGGYS